MASFKDHLPGTPKPKAYARKTMRRADTPAEVRLEEVLFELRRMGNVIKVSAIDPITNVEISMVAPATADPYTIKMNAIRKLEYVIRKKMNRPRDV